MTISTEDRWQKSPMSFGAATILLLLLGLLSGCSSTGDKDMASLDPNSIPDAVPKVEPRSKYGNPASYVVFGRRYYTKASSNGHVEKGVASWYGKKFHGRKTSSGERYDMYAMTAAHKTLPLPTYARVTNVKNGRSAIVKINDRGPFHGNRIIDLSYSAARKLGVVAKGTAMVEVKAIDPRRPNASQQNSFLASSDTAFGPGTPVVKKENVARKRSVEKKPVARVKASETRLAKAEEPPASPQKTLAAAVKAVAVAPSPPVSKVSVAVAEKQSKKVERSAMYLQVGAFGSRTNAEQLRRRLVRNLAEQVQVRATDDKTAHWYKVHVGPLESRKTAMDLSQKLAALGLDHSHIVVEQPSSER